MKERYDELSLTEYQKLMVNDYIACRESRDNQKAVLSYVAGLKDVIKVLKNNNLLNES